MVDGDLSRRDVLIGAGAAGLGAIGLTGEAAAAGPAEYNVGTASPAAERAARDAAERVIRVLDWSGGDKTVTGVFAQQAIENLDNRPDVRYTEVNGTYHAIEETLPWGVDRIDADVAHDNGETGGDGDGAHITIIDTGIDYTHPDLEANYDGGETFVEGTEDEMDDHGHGTHVAGTADAVDNDRDVVGVSTAAHLHAAKVLNEDGSGTWDNVAAGIKWTADQGHDVGNMSLGGSSGSDTVKDACQYAYNKGVLLVAAAGNDGPRPNSVGYPARYEEVIAVSAIDENDDIAHFSSRGPEVELAAPGVDILSTTLGGGTGTKSGTSMASPHVAGAGGQLMDNGYTNTEARSRLNATAEDLGLTSDEQGNGLVDVAAALGLDDGNTENPPAVDSLAIDEVETDNEDAEFAASWAVSDPDGDLDRVELTLYELDSDGNRVEEEATATETVSGDSASGTTRLVAAGDDGSGATYEVEAVVTDAAGNTDSDTATETESEDTGGETAPTIDSFEVSTRTTGPWFRAEADWAVSDSDGDLDTVTTEMLDAGGSVLDSERSDVSGSSASGSDEVRTRTGDEDTVRLTVTDVAGNTTSETRDV